MDKAILDRGLLRDLEGGGAANEEDGSLEQIKKGIGMVWTGTVPIDELPVKREGAVRACPAEFFCDNIDLLGAQRKGLTGESTGKEKTKKNSHKKASKPPRPPKPPQLDAADQKLIKEITELAMLKKARIERLKALRKMRASKSASSGSNMCAMVITIIFCLVIIFQGALSRGRSSINTAHGSPESAVGSEGGGLISIQFYGNTSASSTLHPASESPNIVEQVKGSDKGQTNVASRFRKLLVVKKNHL